MDPLIERLTRVLAGTDDAPPRPLADPGLPQSATHLLNEDAIAGLIPAAVLIPVLARPGAAQILLTVRGHDLRHHPGQISFPGGRREAWDTGAADNALRESGEEIGLRREDATVVGFLDDYPTVTGFRVTPVVAVVTPAARVKADGNEVAATFELPLAFALEAGNYRQDWLERGGLRLPYYRLSCTGHDIWGATAGMLHDLAWRMAAGAASR